MTDRDSKMKGRGVRRKVQLKADGWSDYREVQTENMSCSGLLLRVGDPFPAVGESVEVRLRGGDGTHVELEAQVLRHGSTPTEEGTAVAVRVSAKASGPLRELLAAEAEQHPPGERSSRPASRWSGTREGSGDDRSSGSVSLGNAELSWAATPEPKAPPPTPLADEPEEGSDDLPDLDDAPSAEARLRGRLRSEHVASPSAPSSGADVPARPAPAVERSAPEAQSDRPRPLRPPKNMPGSPSTSSGEAPAESSKEAGGIGDIDIDALASGDEGVAPDEAAPKKPLKETQPSRPRPKLPPSAPEAASQGKTAPAKPPPPPPKAAPPPAAAKPPAVPPAAAVEFSAVAEKGQASPPEAPPPEAPPGGASPSEPPPRGARAPAPRRTPVPPEVAPAPAATGPQSSVKQIGARASTGTRGAPALLGRAAAPVVGIDFGTTYSKVAVFDRGEVVLIEDTGAKAATRAAVPSSVGFRRDGSVVVGEAAREMLTKEPRNVVGSVKRVLGLGYTDPLANGLLGSLACEHVRGPDDSIQFKFHGQTVTVAEVASRVMAHLAQMAGRWAGCKVTRAVMTVPVDFDGRTRREFELAARMAGLEIAALVPEPVAAAMGCGFDGSGAARLAVYDFGGGTFDASIVEVGQNRFVVRGAAGDRWLGGDDLDEILARHVADEFLKSSGVNLHGRVEEWQRLLFASEEAKRWLSTLAAVDVIVPDIVRTAEGKKTLLVPVTREDFEETTEDVITSSLEVCRQALAESGLKSKHIDGLLVTGGTTRVPAVREAAQRFFGKKAMVGVHPEHAVVIGAAVHAAVLSGTPVPEDFAERLRGHGRTQRNIGIALADGTTEHIIEGSRRPPVAAHRLYSTSRDNQSRCRIELVEGSARETVRNRRVGGFVIDGLPAAKAGTISLDVYFELSSTGSLYVTAQERSSGRRAQGSFDLGEE